MTASTDRQFQTKLTEARDSCNGLPDRAKASSRASWYLQNLSNARLSTSKQSWDQTENMHLCCILQLVYRLCLWLCMQCRQPLFVKMSASTKNCVSLRPPINLVTVKRRRERQGSIPCFCCLFKVRRLSRVCRPFPALSPLIVALANTLLMQPRSLRTIGVATAILPLFFDDEYLNN